MQSTNSLSAAQWILAVLAVMSGCRLKPREIEFVVPVGFKGPFVVIVRQDGQSGAFRRGKLTLTVPASRILVIDDDSAFDEMTVRRARYANGDVLAIDNEFDCSLVALRGGGSSAGMRQGLIIPTHDSYFVGTDDEFTKCDFSELEFQIAIQQK